VIVDGRIVLTGFDQGSLLVFARDFASGAALWEQRITPGRIERGARLGNPATATSATDGRRIVSYFGAFGLICHDLNGHELWRKPLPIPVTQHGAGTSPVLVGNRVLLNSDQDTGSWCTALDLSTGETLWRTDRPGALRGFSTPLPWPQAPEVAVIAGSLRLDAYRLSDGTPAWHINGLPNEMVSSPIAAGDRIVVAGWTAGSGVRHMPAWDGLLESGDANHDGMLSAQEAPAGPARQHFAYLDSNKDGQLTASEYATAARAFDSSRNVAMAVRPTGSGDITARSVVWTHDRGLPYCPTPLFLDGRIYLVRNGGLITCLDATTGKPLFQEERLGTGGDHYASPVASGDRICVVSQAGVAVILRAGNTLDILARNPLEESVVATPAIHQGHLIVRSSEHLFSFGPRP
jgi:outer membrane protein assembly factor BamB